MLTEVNRLVMNALSQMCGQGWRDQHNFIIMLRLYDPTTVESWSHERGYVPPCFLSAVWDFLTLICWRQVIQDSYHSSMPMIIGAPNDHWHGWLISSHGCGIIQSQHYYKIMSGEQERISSGLEESLWGWLFHHPLLAWIVDPPLQVQTNSQSITMWWWNFNVCRTWQWNMARGTAGVVLSVIVDSSCNCLYCLHPVWWKGKLSCLNIPRSTCSVYTTHAHMRPAGN